MHQSKHPLPTAFLRWKRVHLEENRHLKTYSTLESIVNNIGELLEQELLRVPLASLRESHVDQLKRRLVKGGWKTVTGKRAVPYTAEVTNKRLALIHGFLVWCASQNLIDPNLPYRVTQLVPPAKAGRKLCKADKTVEPIPWDTVLKIQPCCTPTLWSVIELQYWSAMRPGEVTSMTWGEIDTTGEVWVYRPHQHKTSYLGDLHPVLLGPKSQQILSEYRQINSQTFGIFNRLIHQKERQGLLRGEYGPLVKHWEAYPDSPWDTRYYWRAVRTAAAQAGMENWNPNRLRHTAASEIHDQVDATIAASVLGNTKSVAQAHYIRDTLRRAKEHVRVSR